MTDSEETKPDDPKGEDPGEGSSSEDDLLAIKIEPKITFTEPAPAAGPERPGPGRPRFRWPQFKFPRFQPPRIFSRPAAEIGGVLLLSLIAIFLLYGPRWLMGESIFRGVVQEQYYFLGQYAFDQQILSDLRAGYFPLWNPKNALGTPLLGNMLSAVLYPLKLMIYLHPTVAVRDFYLVLRLLLAALFTLALAREQKLSFLPAALAAMAFAFSGYFKMFVNENYLNADVLLPAAVLLALRLRDRPRLLDFILLAFVGFAVLNNGHPEAAFYTLLLPAFLVAATARSWPRFVRTALLFSGAIGAAVLLSLPLLFPFLEYWARGYHFHPPGAGFFHYAARQISALVTPWFFGAAPAGAPFLFPTRIVWPEELAGVPGYAESAVPWLIPSLGAVPLFLAGLAALAPGKLRRTEAALLVYAVFFMGVMFGLPLFRLLGLIPVFSLSGNFKHPLPGVALAAALLAGRGLSRALERKTGPGTVILVLWTLLLAILGLGIFSEPLSAGPPFLNKYSGLSLLILLGAGALLIYFAYARQGGPAQNRRGGAAVLTGTVILAATLIGLCMDGYVQPMRDPKYEDRIAAGDALAKLNELAPLDRVYISQELAPPNLNLLFGLSDLRVMDGINDRRLVEAINKINGHDRAQAGTYWYRETGYLQPMPDRLNHPLLRLFNVKYAMMDGPLPFNRAIKQVLDEAQVLAPGPEYVGRARFPFAPGSAPGLLTHPPSQLIWQPYLPRSESGREFLPLKVAFRPAIIPAAAAKEPDGVWLSLFSGPNLAYARYLFPRVQPTDDLVPAQSLSLDCENEPRSCDYLVLAALPGASKDYDQAGFADFRSGGDDKFDPGPWREVTRGETWLYQNPEALPRAFIAKTADLMTEADGLDSLAEGEIDPRETVIISERPELGETTPELKGLAGQVTAEEYASQRASFELELWDRGWLVLSDLDYPGWRATLDGNPARLERADFCLRALPLAKGKHRVEMVYEPRSFRIGLWAMLITLLAVPALLIYRSFRDDSR